jgi:hypothetical protein
MAKKTQHSTPARWILAVGKTDKFMDEFSVGGKSKRLHHAFTASM